MPRKKLKVKRRHLPNHGVISGSRYNLNDPRPGGSKRATDKNQKEREEKHVKDEMWFDEMGEEIRRDLQEVEIKIGRIRKAEQSKAKEKALAEALKKRKALQIKKKKKKK